MYSFSRLNDCKGRSGHKCEKSADSVQKYPLIGQFEAYGFFFFNFFSKINVFGY